MYDHTHPFVLMSSGRSVGVSAALPQEITSLGFDLRHAHREFEQKLLGGSCSSGSGPNLTRLDTEEEDQEAEEEGGAASFQQDAAVDPAASSEDLAETLPEVQQTLWPNLHLPSCEQPQANTSTGLNLIITGAT